MSNAVIKVENVSKKYRISHNEKLTTFTDLLSNLSSLPKRIFGGKSNFEDFWALRDVSFEVNQGDVVGIIGRNGSGKSTLLKILSRITEPTEGQITLKGRVASLLEVGTGFNPELTGKENIFLNGSILGMTRAEIRNHFDEIVDFAGVEKFLYTPVKRYSSGMYVRLAFAVSAHLQSEILLVDEVLAVGDAEFQKKCLGKMGNLAKSGRTVLFVSHNMEAIRNICQRVIHLDHGSLINKGKPHTIISNYLNQEQIGYMEKEWNEEDNPPSNENCKLQYAGIRSSDNRPLLTIKSDIIITFKIVNFNDSKPLWFNFLLYTQTGTCVFNTASKKRIFRKGIATGECHIPAKLLNDEGYYIHLYIHYEGTQGIDAGEVLGFQINDERDDDWYGKVQGIIRPSLEWLVKES